MYWLVVLPFTYSYDINLQNGNYDVKNFRPFFDTKKEKNDIIFIKNSVLYLFMNYDI